MFRITQRRWWERALLVPVVAGTLSCGYGRRAPATVEVYRNQGCDCCLKWVDHLRGAGLESEVQTVEIQRVERPVPHDLRSCHTAIVNGYWVEGHVPSDVIYTLISERPGIAGVAVPGMPIGSPGMEGRHKEPYDIVAFDRQGRRFVLASR
jgi:hypothetical protein